MECIINAVKDLTTKVQTQWSKMWGSSNDDELHELEKLQSVLQQRINSIKGKRQCLEGKSSKGQSSGDVSSSSTTGSGRTQTGMSGTEGIMVFTLWYLGIAYNYYMGENKLGAGEECSSSCGASEAGGEGEGEGGGEGGEVPVEEAPVEEAPVVEEPVIEPEEPEPEPPPPPPPPPADEAGGGDVEEEE